MIDLLKFLLYSIKTVDGNRGSSIKLKNMMFQTNINKTTDEPNNSTHQANIKAAIIEELCEHRLMIKTCRKYLMLKIRSKISYMAFEKNMTI